VVASAQGGPPMFTNDPGTPERGTWETNLGWETAWSEAGNEQGLPSIDINYGLTDAIQLSYAASWIRLREAGRDEVWGLSNSEVAAKWRFHNPGEGGWVISAEPAIEFRNPGSHSVRRGLADDGTTLGLAFQFQREMPDFDLNFDIGFAHNSRNPDAWFGGVAIGRELTENVAWAAEIHLDASSDLDDFEIIANVGVRWEYSETFSVLCAVGQDLHNSFGERTEFFSYLGLQIRR